jgi:hypothetical protein
MSSTNPEDSLTPAEIKNRDRLEAIVQPGLATFVEVGNALAEIRDRRLHRDTHRSFETYVRDWWGVDLPHSDPLSLTVPADAASGDKPCEALARACEETLSALDGDDSVAIDIRLAVRKPGTPADGQGLDPEEVAETTDDDLLVKLRWLLARASGTIGEVAHQLERRAADIDDSARVQLRDDVHVLDDDLASVRALLVTLIDWELEFERLLNGELPPHDTDRDPEDD